MNKIRNEIDKIDEKIFKLLKSRFDKAKKIGQLKKYLKVSTDDEKREQEILSKLDDVNISGNYKEEITKVYELIFQLMKDIESKE
jgi:chorismate mutase